MTIIIEDGSVVPNANSYASIAEADVYFALVTDTVWAGKTTAEKEAGLIKGTRFIDATYMFKGTLKSHEQALSFPRLSLVDNEGRDFSGVIPAKLKNALCEFALASFTSNLTPTVGADSAVKRKKVDVLEIEYRDNAPTKTTFSSGQNFLTGLYIGLFGGAMFSSTVRA